MHNHDGEHDRNGAPGLLSRRGFAQAALASAGLFVAGPALAQQPQPPLGRPRNRRWGPSIRCTRWPRTTPT